MENYEFIGTIATITLATVALGGMLLRLEGRISGLEHRMTNMESRMTSIENRFDARFMQLENQLNLLGQRVAAIEGIIASRQQPAPPPPADS